MIAARMFPANYASAGGLGSIKREGQGHISAARCAKAG